MQTLEILSKLTAKTQNYEGVGAGHGDLGWQDILLAMRGIDPEKSGFVLYVYGGYERGHHTFFAGLFMAAMERPDIQEWRSQVHTTHAVENLCLLAIDELKNGKKTHQQRADHLEISLSTWKRRYTDIYQHILVIPANWEKEIIRIIEQRLL